ncbi:hypothetical protein ACFQYP_47650 [Nonomuraea antimicrobica]
MRIPRFFTGIALLAISVSGCSLAAAHEGDVVVPAEPTLIDFVDPATVAGLSTRTLTEGDSSTRGYVHINYPELAHAPALNRALAVRAERQLREFHSRTRGEDASGPRAELNVDWQLAAASPQAVAVRLRTGEFLGKTWGNSTRTYWFDPAKGQAIDSTGLLSGPASQEQLATLVRGLLEKRGSQVDRNELKAGGNEFDSMAFNRSGDLVVEFDDCEIGPCSLGRLAVAVPAHQVAPLLSDLGRRAQESVRAAATRAAGGGTPRPRPRPGSPAQGAGRGAGRGPGQGAWTARRSSAWR